MAKVTVRDKNAAIADLVVDTVRSRIETLREDSDAHWNAIATEVYDADTIKRNNKTVQFLFDERADISISVEEDWNGLVDMMRDDDLRIREITHVVPEDSDDPLALCPCGVYESDYHPDNLFEKIWNGKGKAVAVKLPVKMKFLTTELPPKDTSRSCSLTDPDKYNDNELAIDIDNHVPLDCRTQREFRNRSNAIVGDMKKLTNTLRDSLRNARTDTKVIEVVPELEPYLMVAEKQKASVSELLKKAATKD